MAHVKVKGAGLLAQAMLDARPEVEKAIRKAVRQHLEEPPPGMVRLSVTVTVSEEMLKDEVALGQFLVRAVKRRLK